jgi:hypothetical protein
MGAEGDGAVADSKVEVGPNHDILALPRAMMMSLEPSALRVEVAGLAHAQGVYSCRSTVAVAHDNQAMTDSIWGNDYRLHKAADFHIP